MANFRGNFEMSSAGDDDREYFTYPSNLLQQEIPITGSSSYRTGGAHHEGFVPDCGVLTYTDPSAGCGGQYYGRVYSKPYFQPGDNLEGLGIDLMRMELETITQGFPGSHSCPPPLIQWDGKSNYHGRHPSLDHPALHPMQHDQGESSSTSISPSQSSTSPTYIGYLGSNVVTCHPSIATTSSAVRPLTNIDSVLARSSTPKPCGEHWDRPSAKEFWCLWMSHEKLCLALTTGNRKSVTKHLRDEHNFTCDNKIVACAWDQCMASMQRRNIPRHIVACHLAIKVTCPRCGMSLSRADANKKHQLACTGTNSPAVMEASEKGYSGGVVTK